MTDNLRTQGDYEMLNVGEAIEARHSVRQYTDRKIEDDARSQLQDLIDRCNEDGHLNIQMRNDESGVFEGMMARNFDNVTDYIALIGTKSDDLDERVGYHGERIVILAQQLGLNTCWVALTMKKKRISCEIKPDEKLVCVIALGYGKDQGVEHRSKSMESLCKVDGDMPEWFRKGMEYAMLAPTAMNQQKFLITLEDGKVAAKATGGFYSSVDLGIVKYHFEVGAGSDSFEWA